MYLGRSPCCLMSSPLVPPSGYFQLCTQDNDVFWAHPCSQGDNACDFNDYVAFPLGSTSSSKCFLLNLPPTQIVGCNEHCCVWDLSRKFCIIICLVCVIFLLLHDYSSSRSVWGKCGGRWKAHVSMQLSPTPLLLLIWQPLCHRQCLQAVQECCRLVSVKTFQSSVLSSAFFFFLSIILKSLIDWNDTSFLEKIPTTLTFVSLQTVNLSPTAEMRMDSPSAFYDTTSAESTPLNTKNPSFEVQLPEDSKQRVNKGFRVSEILGTTNNYRNSILEFFTNFAK